MRRALALTLLLAGCSARVAPPPRWDTPRPELARLWDERALSTTTCAILAAVEYSGPPRDRTFTLELFFRQPGSYLLRGRGTLGVEGFRALVVGDSITVLLDRQKRGYAGPASLFPDSATREMWLLLEAALPWITGEVRLSQHPHQIQTDRDGTRPAWVQAEHEDAALELGYGRYRDDYPYWHLRTVKGVSAWAEITLEVRQQLYNPELDPSLFELVLPPGTLPLAD